MLPSGTQSGKDLFHGSRSFLAFTAVFELKDGERMGIHEVIIAYSIRVVKTKNMGFHGPDALCAIARPTFSSYNIYTMEQHPVPQNVTTFQFRLVGDMTIRQFGYLAGGIILGYISYKLPLPFFFTWPLAITSAVGGFGLAFVPIEERPMDVWIMSFFKNVYSPTQYVWQKLKHTRAVPHATPPPG